MKNTTSRVANATGVNFDDLIKRNPGQAIGQGLFDFIVFLPPTVYAIYEWKVKMNAQLIHNPQHWTAPPALSSYRSYILGPAMYLLTTWVWVLGQDPFWDEIKANVTRSKPSHEKEPSPEKQKV